MKKRVKQYNKKNRTKQPKEKNMIKLQLAVFY